LRLSDHGDAAAIWYAHFVKTHTSLLAWREARELSRGVLRLAHSAWRPPLRAVFDQLLRSSLSIQLNIAEGYALGNTGSFRRHLAIAYGSAIETSELLEHLLEVDGTPRAEIQVFLESCKKTERLLLGLIRQMKSR
jgi:four helix bundle protein